MSKEQELERLVADIPAELKREVQARLILYHKRKTLKGLVMELLERWLDEDKQRTAERTQLAA